MSRIIIRDNAGTAHSFDESAEGQRAAWNFVHNEHLAGRTVSDGTCGGGDISRISYTIGRTPFGKV
ncbi:hypothetical protein IKT64_02255 [Candidatus Saccharibacteria bacterium]|nr:hypothetical protein [Candidatus Saccharibacteria bacterium]